MSDEQLRFHGIDKDADMNDFLHGCGNMIVRGSLKLDQMLSPEELEALLAEPDPFEDAIISAEELLINARGFHRRS